MIFEIVLSSGNNQAPPDELPPPYTETPGGIPTIPCKVCNTPIDISHKEQQHVIKCFSCGEATVSISQCIVLEL